MNTVDEALSITNPRLLTAVYFSLLAVIATILFEIALYALGLSEILPFFKAILLGAIVAACFGALFGETIVHSKKPFAGHVFLWAFLMVLIALPFYNIGFVYLLSETHADLFTNADVKHIAYLYLLTMGYNFILAGLWLAIIAGFAAIYLRGHLVYHILHSLNERRKTQR